MRHADPGYTPNMSLGGTTARHGAGKPGTLAALGTVLQRAAKDTLFWEGDPADHVFQVIRGTACLYKLLPDGRRQVARFCHTGDLIGLTVGDEYPYTAGALTELSVSRIRRADLETQVEGERALRRIVVDAIAAELSLAQDQLLLLGRKSAIERVATFLCAMRKQAMLDGGDGRSVFLPMTRVDIADFLGLTHETVCRVMASLKAQGLIATSEPHRIVIRDLETLEDIAEGDAEQRLCA